nr:hypothetical protein [Candidatus Kryptonium thompsoni]
MKKKTDYIEKAYDGKIECLLKRGNYNEVIRVVEEFERKFPSSELLEKVKRMKDEAKSRVQTELRTGR